ncbi:MAG: TrmH family RNA methyltransferase [Clostridiaceae bacterium]
MELISSRENPVIRDTKKLKEKKHREGRKQFLVEGLRFVSEAAESGFEISAIFLSEDMAGKWESMGIKNKINAGTKIYKLAGRLFKDISFTENPQGIAAVVHFRRLEAERQEGFYVLADKIQDPGNLGTIIRSAHASKALGVIITKGTVDVYNDKTLRSTMGSIFHVPVIEDEDLSYLDRLRASGFKLIASSLDTQNNFFQADLCGNVIIAVGNEGAGLSSDIMDKADILVQIPMPGGAESLNVSAAASIMMFEVVRQRMMQEII